MSSTRTATIEPLAAIARRLRLLSLRATNQAGSGHPTSSMSCADLVAALFFHALRFDMQRPESLANDRFVLSKGHAAPVLWAALAEAGAYSQEDLDRLRRIDSELEGHPTPRSRWIDVPTGSLGQGLSIGAGMAWWSRQVGVDNRIWVLLGDGELAEGSNWEAAAVAHHHRLGHLCAIVDVNRLGQTDETMLGHDVDAYRRRFEAFGWRTQVIDGHDLPAIVTAYDTVRDSDDERPMAIIAKTVKGKGVSFLEGADQRHGKAIDGEEYERALEELAGPEPAQVPEVSGPAGGIPAPAVSPDVVLPAPSYDGPTATRAAYGTALERLAAVDERIVVLDGEVSNSTKSEQAAEAAPQRFIECYIAEQNMVGMALGIAALGGMPYVSSFAAFLTRAADQIRMAGIAGHHMVLAGSHAGLSIGEDGPSQMGLEDLALFRAVPGSTVLCPSDAVSAELLTTRVLDRPGISYLRLARPKTPIIHDAAADLPIGGSVTLCGGSGANRIAVVACGVCVAEALEAAEQLQGEITLQVIDAYSIKPLDEQGICAAATETGRLITVEDHYAEGGLGEAVGTALAENAVSCRFRRLAVRKLPRSGDAAALMAEHGIDAAAIVDAARRLAG